MTTYRYKGTSANGAVVEGIVEAFDRQDAVIRARKNCRVVLSVESVPTGKFRDILLGDVGRLLTGGQIKTKALALLCSQLSIALRAGISLVSALRLAAETQKDLYLKKSLLEVVGDIHAGNGLADSFALRIPGLPRTFLDTVRTGEESGRLDDTFERLQGFYENAASVSSRLATAMVYPIMLISAAVVVVSIIMIYAVPVFAASFAQMGSNLPLPTRILITLSNFMVDHWLLLLTILAAAGIGLILYGRTDRGAHLYARILLTIPGLSTVVQMRETFCFSTTLSNMLSAGLPLVHACGISAACAGNILIREDLEKAVEHLLEGKTLTEGLQKGKWLPPLLKEMIGVGEETGKLEETLNVVSGYYAAEVDQAVKRALDIVNPCITIVLALLVVCILLSVYLPIFSLY